MAPEAARSEFLKCCAAERWAAGMVARMPFASTDDLLRTADQIWAQMRTKDWLEAFAGHPRIGDLASLRAKYQNTSDWAQGEQDGAIGASETILQGLQDGNRAYEAKFGHLFIVCATG
ncbi:MAG: OHCU decarboxylase, partial [Cyanobacteria bacterium REEB65]|nr:OHCU decarboxylase [Cyanobacteria bacterium REEB65]